MLLSAEWWVTLATTTEQHGRWLPLLGSGSGRIPFMYFNFRLNIVVSDLH